MTFYEKLLPAPKNCGFKMDGYYIWCGSAIKGEDGRYYLFASRWKKETLFPEGYMTNSEIVLASSNTAEGPYSFEKVIISKRPGNYWDSMMAHNPHIKKIGDEYVLFYIGNSDGTGITRKIGYAKSKSLTNGWIRSDNPINLPPNANNPSVWVEPDGKTTLIFRDGKLKLKVAKAKNYYSEFTVVQEDLFPGIPIEDPFIFKCGDHYEMLVEDNNSDLTGHSRYGAHLISTDGEHWKKNLPVIAYDHTLKYDDGTELNVERRERPQLILDKDGNPEYLFTAVLCNNCTWSTVQKINNDY